MIAWDLETALIQPGVLAPPIACLTWYSEGDEGLLHHADPKLKEHVETTLGQDYVGANIAYDLACVSARWPDLMPRVFDSFNAQRGHDVCIRQKLIDIGEGRYRGMEIAGVEGEIEPSYISIGYSLSDIHKRYFGAPMEKDAFRLQYGKLRHLPLTDWPSGAVQYAKADAEATYRIWHRQQSMKVGVPADEHRTCLRIPVEEYLVDESAQVSHAFALQLISCWGILTDADEVKRFLAVLKEEQDKRREHLIKQKLVKPTGARDMAAAKAFMRHVAKDACQLTPKGVELYRAWQKTPSVELTQETKLAKKRELFAAGYVKLSADACLSTKNKDLQEFAKYGQFQTLCTKVAKLNTGGMPIQTAFESLRETGRTSSYASKIIYNSVATQNLPRKDGMRECFVPRGWQAPTPAERNVFIACDFGMAELVALAQVTYSMFGFSCMRDVLNAGQDPHLKFAATTLGLQYDIAVQRKHEKELKDQRQMAKTFSFGVPGGLGIEKFILFARVVYGVVFASDPVEAEYIVRKYKEMWFQEYPEVKLYHRYFGNLCERDGYCDIRQFKSNRLRGRIHFTVACNTMFQGLTADAAKAALVEVCRLCYTVPSSVLYGCRVVNFIHDEILLECPEWKAHEVAMELQRVMVEQYQRWTPDVNITAEAAIMRRWRKGAAPVWSNNRLIPWEDRQAA